MQFKTLCALAVSRHQRRDAPSRRTWLRKAAGAAPIATPEGEPVVVRTDGPRETLRGRLVSPTRGVADD